MQPDVVYLFQCLEIINKGVFTISGTNFCDVSLLEELQRIPQKHESCPLQFYVLLIFANES
jgi:hypothetical protein